MRAGDVVKHKPSGERWIVAYVENGWLAPCGWPFCETRLDACELVETATDARHRETLEAWCAVYKRGGFDSWDRRPVVCFEQLCLLNVAFAGAHI